MSDDDSMTGKRRMEYEDVNSYKRRRVEHPIPSLYVPEATNCLKDIPMNNTPYNSNTLKPPESDVHDLKAYNYASK